MSKTLLHRREMMQALSPRKVPSDFQKVEYIETGTAYQYIDTHIYYDDTNDTYEIESMFELLQFTASTYYSIFGVYEDGEHRNCLRLMTGDATYSFLANFNAVASTPNYSVLQADVPPTGQIYNVRLNNNVLSFNGIIGERIDPTAGASSPLAKTFKLFNIYSNGNTAPARIYSFRLFSYGVLVSDLVPCYRKADNMPGMYDVERDIFLPRGVANTMYVGPDIN